MSSPMMTRMFGGGSCCALATSGVSMTASAAQAKKTARARSPAEMKIFTYSPSVLPVKELATCVLRDGDPRKTPERDDVVGENEVRRQHDQTTAPPLLRGGSARVRVARQRRWRVRRRR